MKSATIQLVKSPANLAIDHDKLVGDLTDVGVDYYKQNIDLHDVDALKRIIAEESRADVDNLSLLPLGERLHRPATRNEQAAYRISENAVITVYLEADGSLVTNALDPGETKK